MATYYNEFDPYAAQWLRNLIAAGHIAQGEVDERSICDVDPADLAGFTQCHFFAGIGVWSHALRLAGWPDDRPVWTGSCPCQPFSAAGKGRGFDDERHLWPEFFRLIRERRPAIVFGEQVASKDGLEWLDLVQADLEGAGYASAAADICAAGVGAPHIRQRLWWVGVASSERRAWVRNEPEHRQFVPTDAGAGWMANASGQRRGEAGATCGRPPQRSADGGAGGWMADASGQRQRADQFGRDCGDRIILAGPEPRRNGSDDGGLGGLADGSGARLEGRDEGPLGRKRASTERGDRAGGMADTVGVQREREPHIRPAGLCEQNVRQAERGDGFGDMGASTCSAPASRPTNGHWRDADWLYCRDGKWRPVEPGTFPLAHGASARVGRLRAYGNAIVPQVAQAFIKAVMEVRP